ncbi:hypothetical protein I547_3920 [Mycobacterium kansasii 824]|uniref:Uncharacterized protein n=1 Tax=Mycobacterium kansasii TaxID=1768 RepID=A0A1V3XLE9_MYCKA|nr:hypothetical protein I547_3920 [Mycobacterium kansasii 824]KEP40059.1 hypothetical protein MKSMC1_48080 [Mycobacterium kansasii]OOK79089.1 hypothetical protein BZL30_2201 [Mycobacterium kansasii]OOK80035.1 hypothetical protein BZL29_2194 [Mycobacterium kansasii]
MIRFEDTDHRAFAVRRRDGTDVPGQSVRTGSANFVPQWPLMKAIDEGH